MAKNPRPRGRHEAPARRTGSTGAESPVSRGGRRRSSKTTLVLQIVAATLAGVSMVSAFLFRDLFSNPTSTTTSTTSPVVTTAPPPPSTTVPAGEVADVAIAALEAAGLVDISVVVEDGVLYLGGVIPPGRLEEGVFGFVDTVTGTAGAALPGVEVRSRLRVRGDAALAARLLDDLVEWSPIVFETGSSTLPEQYHPVLDRVGSVIRANPGLVVLVGGHTDPAGSASANRRLAQARAQAVIDYLIAQGIGPARLAVISYGELLADGEETAQVRFEVAP